jgi:large subunit ribosomal protein L21
MYAVIKQGGRQYRVTPGDIIQIDLIPTEKGAEVELDGVLMVSDGEMLEIGAPRCDDFRIKAKVIRTAPTDKLER